MISTCIITNRFDEKLKRAVDSVNGLGEVVLVETSGATPKSVWFRNYHTYPWGDDFAKARNYALEKAKGRWVLSLDADEWIDAEGRTRLGWIANQPAHKAYYTRLIDNGKYILDQVKIFPNNSNIRWVGRVHEQILPSIVQAGLPVDFSGINIYHDGYVNCDELEGKQRRNQRIISKWLREEPNNEWAYFWNNYINNR